MFYAHWQPSHDANLVATDVTGGCRYDNCQTHCVDKSGILAISNLNWSNFLNKFRRDTFVKIAFYT